MEINKAIEVFNNVTANVNGTRQDHQIIAQAIQVITRELQKGEEAQKEIIKLIKENENLRGVINPEEVKEKKSK